MKKVIIFASLFYAVSLNAQIYKPLLTEGKKMGVCTHKRLSYAQRGHHKDHGHCRRRHVG